MHAHACLCVVAATRDAQPLNVADLLTQNTWSSGSSSTAHLSGFSIESDPAGVPLKFCQPANLVLQRLAAEAGELQDSRKHRHLEQVHGTIRVTRITLQPCDSGAGAFRYGVVTVDHRHLPLVDLTAATAQGLLRLVSQWPHRSMSVTAGKVSSRTTLRPSSIVAESPWTSVVRAYTAGYLARSDR